MDSTQEHRPAAETPLEWGPGFAWLDPSGAESGWGLAVSGPERVFRGRDWRALERGLADVFAGRAVAVGTVDYEGEYRFGVYGRWRQLAAGAELPDFGRPHPNAPAADAPVPGMDEAAYVRAVCRAQEYIAAGDIYQVNLAHRFRMPWAGDGWGLFRALRRVSPAPFSAYLHQGDREVISASPECFLRIEGRRIVTRPIKGTRPRRIEPGADAREERELIGSAKERAELLMITDLERNDLGQVCEFGSVRVSELLKLERFRHVFHLVSTVEGELREGVSPVAALAACFPGGSITGAPKRRAMEIIRELEPEPRGLYTGALGVFGPGPRALFSIVIRTALAERGELHFHAGAGIVADSDPAREYRETMEKAAGLLEALAAWRVRRD